MQSEFVKSKRPSLLCFHQLTSSQFLFDNVYLFFKKIILMSSDLHNMGFDICPNSCRWLEICRVQTSFHKVAHAWNMQHSQEFTLVGNTDFLHLPRIILNILGTKLFHIIASICYFYFSTLPLRTIWIFCFLQLFRLRKPSGWRLMILMVSLTGSHRMAISVAALESTSRPLRYTDM